MKVCGTCKVEKSVDDFYKDKRRRDGLYPDCKVCHCARTKRYYQTNTNKVKERQKSYRDNNQDKLLVINQQWRDNNRDRIAETTSAWAKANRDKRRGYYQKYRATKIANGTFKISDREISKLYSSSCFYCGSKENITLDHIVPISRGGVHSIGNIVPACAGCNCSKNNRTITEWKQLKRRISNGLS